MANIMRVGGGSGGNELIVTAPTGSTVTATKDSVTKTATENNGVFTFKGLEAGEWTVTAILGDNAASEVVTVGETVIISYKPTASTTATSGVTYTNGISGVDTETVSLFAEAISNNSAITQDTSVVYIDYGKLHYMISVGDQITLSLNGTSYLFDIIGFNHDTLTDSTAYGDETATGFAGITLQMHNLFATTYSMNGSQTNVGGWASSVMRTSTMVAMKSYLPDDWEAIVKPVNKTAGKGGTSNGWSGTDTVSDNCFLLSEIEVRGAIGSSKAGEGSQYAYYKAGNPRNKNYDPNATTGYAAWWLRSPAAVGYFCSVDGMGAVGSNSARNAYGVAFAFCV